MQDYQKDFIDFALNCDVLRFGEFTLKSGRISPYFFNAGLFNTGEMLAKLGQHYAAAIVDSGIEFDVLFGRPTRASPSAPPRLWPWPNIMAAMCLLPLIAKRPRNMVKEVPSSVHRFKVKC